IEMRRRLPSEHVERLRADQADAFLDLRRQAVRWGEDSIPELRHADPEMPEGLNDRAADNWRFLVAIADLAGGEWPARARETAMALSGDSATDTDSVRTMLLADAADLIEAANGRLASTTLGEQLGDMEERPWPEWNRGR